MATIGNLFVTVGASTTGLNNELNKASKKVADFRGEVVGALSKVPASGMFVNAFMEAESFFKKIIGDAAGAKKALSEIKTLETGLANAIVDGQKKVAAAVEKSKVAQDALAAATKKQQENLARVSQYSKLKSSAEKSSTKLESLRPQLEAAAASYKSAQANVGRATTEEAVAAAIDKESRALAKFNAMLMERNALENKRLKSVSGLEASRTGMQRSGIELNKSGNPNMRKLNDTSTIDKLKSEAAAAKGNIGIVTEAALAKQQVFKDKIVGTFNSLKSFSAMSIGSAAGVAVLGGAMIAATGAAIALTLKMARIADELNDQAQAMGLTVGNLQNLRDTYLQLGVSSGAAESQMQRMQISLQGGDEKTTGAAAAFKKLGLSMEELREMSPDDALNKTIEAIRKLNSQSLKMKTLRDIFGRGGTGLAAAVNATNEELALAKERADKLRLPDSMITSLAATHDNVEMVHRSFSNLQMMFASSFAPAVDNMAKSMFDLMTTDTSSMLGGMQAIAIVCAVIYDVLALIVNLGRSLWNILTSLVGIIASGITLAMYAVMKIVQGIVYAFEFLTGSGHAMSESIASEAEIGLSMAKDLAEGAGSDIAEALQAGIDAGRPDATLGVVQKIQAGESNQDKIKQSAGAMVDPQVTAQAKKNDDLLSKMSELEQAAREVKMTPMEKSLEEVRRLAQSAGLDIKGVDEMAKRAEMNLKAVMIGDMENKLSAGLKQAQEELWLLQEGAAKFAYEQAKAAGATDAVAQAMRKTAEETDTTKKQTAALTTLKNLQEQIANDAAEAGMNERQKLEYQLKKNGLLDAEVQAQLKIKDTTDSKNKTSGALTSWNELVNSTEAKLFEASSSREDQLRKMATAAGLLGADMDAAIANVLKLETSLTEATKLQAAKEASASTLEGLIREVREKTIGKNAFAREEFLKGEKDPAKIAEFDKLTAERDRLDAAAGMKDSGKDVQNNTGSIETAFGSFKFATDSMDKTAQAADKAAQAQNKLQGENEKHTDLLTEIANKDCCTKLTEEAEKQIALLQIIADNSSIGKMIAEENASGAQGGVQTNTVSIDPLLKEANSYLKEIAANTKGQLT